MSKWLRTLPKHMTAEQFNELYPPGTSVNYYPTRGDDGHLTTETRTPAWTLGHGEPVVSVVGISGGVSLTHVEIIEEELAS